VRPERHRLRRRTGASRGDARGVGSREHHPARIGHVGPRRREEPARVGDVFENLGGDDQVENPTQAAVRPQRLRPDVEAQLVDAAACLGTRINTHGIPAAAERRVGEREAVAAPDVENRPGLGVTGTEGIRQQRVDPGPELEVLIDRIGVGRHVPRRADDRERTADAACHDVERHIRGPTRDRRAVRDTLADNAIRDAGFRDPVEHAGTP
jgi:hypothetical protein